MKGVKTGSILGLALLGLAGCSTSNLQNFNRNLLAEVCDNPTQAIDNLPLVINAAQAQVALQGLCGGVFGTAPAPTPAPGNVPALPVAPAAAPAVGTVPAK